MQDMIVLGFLAFRDLSMYELKKAMEQSTAMFYNASLGSIHPALKKLEKAGYITSTEEATGRRPKRIFQRTESGAEVFLAWISEPLKNNVIKDEAILRIFFIGQQDRDVSEQINNYILELKQQQSAMLVLQQNAASKEIPEQYRQAAFFQLQTLKFGIDYLEFCQNWLSDMLKQYHLDIPTS